MKDYSDPDTKAVALFLQAIVETQKQLNELARLLRTRPEVKNVTIYPFIPSNITQHHWDEEQQKQAYGSDFGVSAELDDGTVLDWWLEIRCDADGWHINSNIHRSDLEEDGSHRIVEFVEKQPLTLGTFTEQLSETVAALVANTDASQRPLA